MEIVQNRRIGQESEASFRFTEAGTFPGKTTDDVHFSQPLSLLTQDDGSVLLIAYGSNEILQLDVNGLIVNRIRGPLNGFDRPVDILRQANGNLLVSEYAGDRVALDLGASSIYALRKVIFPQILPGIVTGLIMAFTISIDDVVVSYFTSGPRSQTLGVLIFAMTKKRISPEINALSTVIFYRRNTGKRIGEHFVYIADHFVRDQEEADRLNAMNSGSGFQPWGKLYPGDVVYKDLNGDGKIDNEGDRIPMGYPRIPEIQFGIPIGIQYKGLDF